MQTRGFWLKTPKGKDDGTTRGEWKEEFREGGEAGREEREESGREDEGRGRVPWQRRSSGLPSTSQVESNCSFVTQHFFGDCWELWQLLWRFYFQSLFSPLLFFFLLLFLLLFLSSPFFCVRDLRVYKGRFCLGFRATRTTSFFGGLLAAKTRWLHDTKRDEK